MKLQLTKSLLVGLAIALLAVTQPVVGQQICAEDETYFPGMHLSNGDYISSGCAPIPNAVFVPCTWREKAMSIGAGILGIGIGIIPGGQAVGLALGGFSIGVAIRCEIFGSYWG